MVCISQSPPQEIRLDVLVTLTFFAAHMRFADANLIAPQHHDRMHIGLRKGLGACLTLSRLRAHDGHEGSYSGAEERKRERYASCRYQNIASKKSKLPGQTSPIMVHGDVHEKRRKVFILRFRISERCVHALHGVSYSCCPQKNQQTFHESSSRHPSTVSPCSATHSGQTLANTLTLSTNDLITFS